MQLQIDRYNLSSFKNYPYVSAAVVKKDMNHFVLPLLSPSTSSFLTKSLQRVIYTDYNEKTNEYNTDLEKTGGRMTEGGQSGGQSLVLYRQSKVHVKKKVCSRT